jgi:hypothetical protein
VQAGVGGVRTAQETGGASVRTIQTAGVSALGVRTVQESGGGSVRTIQAGGVRTIPDSVGGVRTIPDSVGGVRTIQAGSVRTVQGTPPAVSPSPRLQSPPAATAGNVAVKSDPPAADSFAGCFASFVAAQREGLGSPPAPVANGQTHKLVSLKGPSGTGPSQVVGQMTGSTTYHPVSSSLVSGQLQQEVVGAEQVRKRSGSTEIGPMEEKRARTNTNSGKDYVFF